MDGRVINVRSFFDGAPEISKNVPMLIGNVSEEGMRHSSNPTEEEWHKSLSTNLGADKAFALIALMKKNHPEKSIRTLSYGVQGLSSRNNVQRMVKMKHEQGGAPVYQYFFTWQSPMLKAQVRGTRQSLRSASTIRSGANRARATRLKHKLSERRWPPPGLTSRVPGIRLSHAWPGLPVTQTAPRPWCSTMLAAWSTTLKPTHAPYCSLSPAVTSDPGLPVEARIRKPYFPSYSLNYRLLGIGVNTTRMQSLVRSGIFLLKCRVQ